MARRDKVRGRLPDRPLEDMCANGTPESREHMNAPVPDALSLFGWHSLLRTTTL